MTQAHLITGKTYQIRRELRSAGCIFDRNEMGYIIAADRASAALEIAKMNGLDVQSYEASEEQITPATGERLRAIRQDRQDRRRERLIQRAEAAERRAEKHRNRVSPHEREFLSLMEPIKVGHHSGRRHMKLVERAQKAFMDEGEELNKAHSLRTRADYVSAARIKGDAEADRQRRRDEVSKAITIGSQVNSVVYGRGVVTKINRKTLAIKLNASGSTVKVDKSHVSVI